ncbi:hypothetical protein BGZ94_005041 [Podila epigama]|nr:hypothetical protein BGZ94_005041 [Podila epigama]
MGLWSRSTPSTQTALSYEYQESIAHRVRDILTGADHPSHNQQKRNNKIAIKALQSPEALAGVIEILKAMPEPECRIDLDSDDDEEDKYRDTLSVKSSSSSNSNKDVDLVAGTAPALATRIESESTNASARPKATTMVAATTIAAAAATSAVAATLAVTIRKHNKPGTDKTNVDGEKSGTVTEITKNTVIRFHPASNTVSSCAYWWGYEIFIPQEALSRIASAQDVSTAFLGFLGSVGLVVPAIVPFLGYIAAYVGLQFAVIKAQNEGKGVILASTWLVPVALVPRAWDFVDDD